MPIGAILLAAGGSRRFGAENKLLALLDGRPLVAHAAQAIADAGLPMLVVTGHQAEAVRAAIAPFSPAFVHAPDWAQGMGASLARGAAAIPPEWTGALVALGDMPHVPPADLGLLAAALTAPESIAVPVHAGAPGNPVGFGRAWFPALAGLTGDEGARHLLRTAEVTRVPCGPGVLRDVDRPEDLSAAGG